MPQQAGLAPNQLPAVADLSSQAFMPLEGQVFVPQTGVMPHMPGQAVWRRDSDTSLTVLYKGLDGVVRGITLSPMVPM